LTLSDAIAAAEATQASLTTADSTKAAAQLKADAAQATLTQATSDDVTAIKAANDALDVLIATATASKRS